MQPEILAAIDLGSNSFHLILAEVRADGLRWQEALSEKVQLAAGLDENMVLDRRAQERGLACLARFAERVSAVAPGNLRVVGTSTLREARNADEFLQRAERLLGCPVRVLTGREEACLIDLGVAHSLVDNHLQRLVVDIGGGSTEMVIGQGLEVRLAESLFMGCVVFTRRYFADGQASACNFDAARQQAEKLLQPVTAAFRQLGWRQAFGSSGTMKAVALACGDDTEGIEMAITRRGLNGFKKQLMAQGSLERLVVKGVAPDRCRILPAGVAILEAVMDSLGLERLVYVNAALREGVIHDTLAQRRPALTSGNASLASLMRHHGVDEVQAERVTSTALHFYEQQDQANLQPIHQRLLRIAARLHELGLSVSREQYDKHGAYLLQHMELPGLAVQESKRVAQLVRAHRRRVPPVLLLEQNALWLDMAMLLRLAVCLNHARREMPLEGVRLVKRTTRSWHLSLPPEWRDKRPLLLADLKENQLWLRKADIAFAFAFETP